MRIRYRPETEKFYNVKWLVEGKGFTAYFWSTRGLASFLWRWLVHRKPMLFGK